MTLPFRKPLDWPEPPDPIAYTGLAGDVGVQRLSACALRGRQRDRGGCGTTGTKRGRKHGWGICGSGRYGDSPVVV